MNTTTDDKGKLCMNPVNELRRGVTILNPVLVPHGFRFHMGGKGKGSGGEFAWGSFKRDDRQLKFHVRFALGLVTYRIGSCELDHASYMRMLGGYGQNRYPGFEDDIAAQFSSLASDLERFAQDFINGPGEEFCRLAKSYQETPGLFKGLPR